MHAHACGLLGQTILCHKNFLSCCTFDGKKLASSRKWNNFNRKRLKPVNSHIHTNSSSFLQIGILEAWLKAMGPFWCNRASDKFQAAFLLLKRRIVQNANHICLNCKSYSSELQKIFVKITKCCCPNSWSNRSQAAFFLLESRIVQIANHIFPNCKSNFSKLQNVFV